MKKILSVALAFALVLGIGAMAFGASEATKDNVTLGNSDGTPIGSAMNDEEGRPGEALDVAKLYILVNTHTINKKQVRDEKIGVQLRSVEGSNVITGATIKYDEADKAYIVLDVVKKWASTGSQNFNVKVYPTVNRTRAVGENAEVEVTGTVKNYSTAVTQYDEYIFIGDAPVVEAKDYIKEIQVDFGSGFSIYTKMFADKKYYGAVSTTIKSEDEEVLNTYSDIDMVYYVETINLKGSGNNVKFDVPTNMFVYVQDDEGNLTLLGRTKDRLPYHTKYFLADKELDIVAVPTEPDVDGTPEPTPDEGGDDAPIDNSNLNPGTGR